ncbi:hypothetical protein [Amnibacterium kyonggiense]
MEDPLDALRRRLYEPGSTAADVEAYRAAEAERLGAAEEPAGSVAARRGRRRGPLVAGALLVAGAAVAALAVLARPEVPSPSASTAAPAGTIAVSAGTRARFVSALEAGQDPGLLSWLFEHPEARDAALLGEGRADSTAFTGDGPTTLMLSPTSEKERAGHITVVLLTDRDARYVWQATVVAESNDRSGPDPAVAEHDGSAGRGAPVTGTVGYDGGVPTRLTLLLPTGIRWAAVVVYSD